jgi:DNA-binding NarL/FixJ family response regulator
VVDGDGSDAEVVVVCSTGSVPERIAAVTEAAHEFPDLPIVATMPSDASGRQLRHAILGGAHGIVFDDRVHDTMAATALAAISGQLAVPMSAARRVAPQALSHREKEVMALVARGYTNRQIARDLFLAESTIKTHLSSALRKLDAGSRAEAAARVLDPDEGYDLLTFFVLAPSATKDRSSGGR